MGYLDIIKNKLPAFVVRNEVLNDLLGPIGHVIDEYLAASDTQKAASGVEGGNPALLDAMAEDYGLIRHYNDTDKIMAIRLMNAIQTHQQRGTKIGLETEGAEISQVTPHNPSMRFVVGVSAIGTGWALGGIGATWLQFWNDTPESEATIKAKMSKVLPLHVKEGIDYIDAYVDPIFYEAIRGADLVDADNFTITNTGFIYDNNTLIPEVEAATFTFGNIDIGAGFASYQWLVDWVDYAVWDIDHTLLVEARFSSDEISWSSWTEYQKNQWVAGAEIDRYVQFRLTLTMTTYRSLQHYIFRSFILKGLTTDQERYNNIAPVLEVLPQIGN